MNSKVYSLSISYPFSPANLKTHSVCEVIQCLDNASSWKNYKAYRQNLWRYKLRLCLFRHLDGVTARNHRNLDLSFTGIEAWPSWIQRRKIMTLNTGNAWSSPCDVTPRKSKLGNFVTVLQNQSFLNLLRNEIKPSLLQKSHSVHKRKHSASTLGRSAFEFCVWM